MYQRCSEDHHRADIRGEYEEIVGYRGRTDYSEGNSPGCKTVCEKDTGKDGEKEESHLCLKYSKK